MQKNDMEFVLKNFKWDEKKSDILKLGMLCGRDTYTDDESSGKFKYIHIRAWQILVWDVQGYFIKPRTMVPATMYMYGVFGRSWLAFYQHLYEA